MIDGRILIVDLGYEDCTIIQEDLASIGIEAVICPHDVKIDDINSIVDIRGIILSGGPNKTEGGFRVEASEDIYDVQLPVYSVDHAGPAGVDLYSWPEKRQDRLREVEYFLCEKCGFKF